LYNYGIVLSLFLVSLGLAHYICDSIEDLSKKLIDALNDTEQSFVVLFPYKKDENILSKDK
jgi:hypothetical protein